VKDFLNAYRNFHKVLRARDRHGNPAAAFLGLRGIAVRARQAQTGKKQSPFDKKTTRKKICA